MKLNQKKILPKFDWISLTITLILSSLGLAFVYSSTYTPEIPHSIFFKKQLLGFLTGFIIYTIAALMPAQTISLLGYLGYFGSLTLVAITLIKGNISGGARRWLSLGIIKFQPSELLKICYPLFLSFFISMKSIHSKTPNSPLAPSNLIFPTIMLLAGFLLVAKQPDLGTALIILAIGISLLWIAGLPTYILILAAITTGLTAPIIWKNLHPYQQKRILVLMGHGEANRDRYQLEQAKISVGSGGLTGKGFLKGTQNKLSFLPEDHNDFIFAVICEELGLAGALTILTLFALLTTRLLTIATSIPNPSHQVILTGTALILALSVIINTGMVIGILPVVGIPLPLFSYGLTNLWITLASLGCSQAFSKN